MINLRPLWSWTILLLAITSQAFPVKAEGSDDGWTLRRESAEFKILTRDITGSNLKAVRIETTLPAQLDKVATLLIAPLRRLDWDEMCKNVKILSTSTQSTRAYYHYDMPWPVRDRDIVLETEAYRDGGTLVISSKAVLDKYTPEPERIRVTEAWYRWQLSPVADDKTTVVAEMFMDPAGPIPAWLLNRLALTQPAKTLERLNRVLELEDSLSNE